MNNYFRALGWGLFGATAGSLIFVSAAYILAAICLVLAIACAVVLPVMAIFFPAKLLEFTKPTKEDREIARRIDERLSR